MGRRWRQLLALAFAAVGLGVIAWIVTRTGFDAWRRALGELLAWAPLLFALEGARIGVDAWTTGLLYERSVRASRLVRATLGAYPVVLLAPAGRAGGEVLKAAVLASEVGRVRAASTAVLLSALPLLAHAVVSVPCVIAAYAVWGPTGLTGAIALQLGTAVALGGFLLVASRARQVGRLVERLSVELGAETERVQADLRAMGRLGWRAFGLQLVGRALLLLEIVLLAAAAGVPRGLVGGLLTAGVHFVGQAVGDVVPAQLGVVDGAWALAASALNAFAAALAAAAITFHAVRLAWAALGSVAFVGMRR